MQCPPAIASCEEEENYRKMMVSMRKDIECAFGTLKGRFRILKYGLRFPNVVRCENVMFTCITLHNMLLEWDGLDATGTHINWNGSEGEHEPEVMLKILLRDSSTLPTNCNGDFTSQYLLPSMVGRAEGTDDESSDNIEISFLELQKKLVTNFAALKKYGPKPKWPKIVKK